MFLLPSQVQAQEVRTVQKVLLERSVRLEREDLILPTFPVGTTSRSTSPTFKFDLHNARFDDVIVVGDRFGNYLVYNEGNSLRCFKDGVYEIKFYIEAQECEKVLLCINGYEVESNSFERGKIEVCSKQILSEDSAIGLVVPGSVNIKNMYCAISLLPIELGG